MFVIVYNKSVIMGPMRWNRFRFQNELLETCEVEMTLLDRNDNLAPLIISKDIQILPVQGTPNPDYNPKIEFLNGPFWEFTDSAAISSYRVEPLAVDAVKNMLKAEAAAERWRKEITNVEVTVAGTAYKFPTDRDTRYVLQNALLSSTNAFNWKLSTNTWVTLTNVEIQAVLDAITSHVQGCFDWEFAKIGEIDTAETLAELDLIIIKEVAGVN